MFKSSKSKFDTEADLESFAGCFDKGLKTAFSEDSKPKFVKFGPARDVHESSRNKAVAFGAISYCLDRFVAGRLIKYTYGTIAHIDFDVCDPEHLGRSGKKRFNVTGGFALEVFVPVLTKVGTRVSDTEEFSDRFVSMGPFPPRVAHKKPEEVIRYKGGREKPQWIDLESDNFEIVCHVVVDASEIPCCRFISPVGTPCFIQAYEVVCTYGQIELKAHLRWTEGDEEKRYPSLF